MAKALKSRSASSKSTKDKPKVSDIKQLLLGADEDTKANTAGNDSAKSDYSSNSNSMMNAPDSSVRYEDLSYQKNPQKYSAPNNIPLDKGIKGASKPAASWSKSQIDSSYTEPYSKTALKDLKAPDIVNQSKRSETIVALGNMKAPGPKDSDYGNIRDNSNIPAAKGFEAYSSSDLDPSKNNSIVGRNIKDSLTNSNSSVTQQNYKDNSGKIGDGDFSDISKGNSEFKNTKNSAVKQGSPAIANSTFNNNTTIPSDKIISASMPEKPNSPPGGDPLKGASEPQKAKNDYMKKTSLKTKDSIMSPVNESILSKTGSLSINVFK